MFAELLVIFIITFIIVQVIRRVLQSGSQVIEEARRSMAQSTSDVRSDTIMVRTPPGPRGTMRLPRPAPATRPATRSSARRSGGGSLDDWYLILDVSPAATRREIQEAIRLRLSRARAARDTEAARRVIRAGAIGMAQARRHRQTD